MTIRRGDAWGEAVESPHDLHIAPTDAAAREWVVAHRSRDRAIGPLGLAGGDLARTLGAGTGERFPGTVTRAPLDVLRVSADGDTTWSVAHVVARRSWWRGTVVFAMNAQYFGPYDVAPRSHPNDGRVDIVQVDAAMPIRARLQARRRARTGTHLPHPALQVTQVPEFGTTFARPLVIWVDGVRWKVAATLEVVVEPDALLAYA
jgi:hypothetical protein